MRNNNVDVYYLFIHLLLLILLPACGFGLQLGLTSISTLYYLLYIRVCDGS